MHAKLYQDMKSVKPMKSHFLTMSLILYENFCINSSLIFNNLIILFLHLIPEHLTSCGSEITKLLFSLLEHFVVF